MKIEIGAKSPGDRVPDSARKAIFASVERWDPGVGTSSRDAETKSPAIGAVCSDDDVGKAGVEALLPDVGVITSNRDAGHPDHESAKPSALP